MRKMLHAVPAVVPAGSAWNGSLRMQQAANTAHNSEETSSLCHASECERKAGRKAGTLCASTLSGFIPPDWLVAAACVISARHSAHLQCDAHTGHACMLVQLLQAACPANRVLLIIMGSCAVEDSGSKAPLACVPSIDLAHLLTEHGKVGGQDGGRHNDIALGGGHAVCSTDDHSAGGRRANSAGSECGLHRVLWRAGGAATSRLI